MRLRPLALFALVTLAPAFAACTTDTTSNSDDITDVKHTDVERQSIGNCWLYAQSSWIESLHLAATGDSFDNSQSYWTYWHWFDQITGYMYGDEVSTGGNQSTSNNLAIERGMMRELDFVPEDDAGEMSDRQKTALGKINDELKSGRLADREARRNGELVRDVMDEAWGLSDGVAATLDDVFGEDGKTTLRHGADAEGTAIVPATAFEVQYTARSGEGEAELIDTTLDVAINEWRTVSYPGSGWWGADASDAERRSFLIRVQRALHDAQPVVVTWNVDFNAMENRDNELQGSFNLTTLEWNGDAGSQGGHMTVFEDYQAVTEEYGLLEAGVYLDPDDAADAAKLAALLEPSTEIQFFRIKNSWGSLRPDREFAPGYPGYHDLYMDYLNGPIAWCPSRESGEDCSGSSVPLRDVMLPPGY